MKPLQYQISSLFIFLLPGTQAADKSCYSKNEGGSRYGYCRKLGDTYIPCKAK